MLNYSEDICKLFKNTNNAYNLGDSDFSIKRNDTCPVFEVKMINSETGAPVSYEDWNVFTSMFYESKINNALFQSESDNIISFMKQQHVCQIKIGDIIRFEECYQNYMEYALVTDIDIVTGEIIIERDYNDSLYGTSYLLPHVRGERVVIFRFFNKSGYIRSLYEDNEELTEEEMDYSVIGYQWDKEDTSHSGEYYLEFELNNNNLTRSFPVDKMGYKINIYPDSNKL